MSRRVTYYYCPDCGRKGVIRRSSGAWGCRHCYWIALETDAERLAALRNVEKNRGRIA